MKSSQWLKDIRDKNDEELNAQSVELLKSKFTLNLQKYGDGLEKTHLFRENRRNLARIKTVLSERKQKGIA